MKLLITGGTGFLGRRAAGYLREQGYRVLTPAHKELDITEEASVERWFREHRPDVVIHTAAVSDTGLCQREPERTERVNVAGCVHLARACREWGGKLVICSSDQVYSGSTVTGPHGEEESLSPNNVYGNQKLRAERECLAILPETVCLRLSWMYSTVSFPGEHGHFLTTLKAALEDENLPLTWPVWDVRGITDADEVVRRLPMAWELPGGVYNFGSENDADTFHTVGFLLEKLGLTSALARLTPNTEAFAAQPRNLAMDTAKIRAAGMEFPTTKEGLLKALGKTERSDGHMTLYICLDDRNGLRFNRRRQSRDSAVLEDIRGSLTGPLCIDAFSEKLIREAEIPYVLLPEETGDFFAEDVPPEELLARTEKIVIYRWNRHYPSDVKWEPDLAAMGFALGETTEFPGTSHEKITREVYER